MHEPEEKFNMDKYTDLVTVSKPVIYISIEEIINTHLVREAKGRGDGMEVCGGVIVKGEYHFKCK